jgi:competence protein ComEA
VLVVFLLAAATIAGVRALLPHLQAEEASAIEFKEEPLPATEATLSIAVTGAVDHPGLYSIAETSTIAELLRVTGAAEPDQSPAIDVYVHHAGDAFQAQRVDINRAESWLLEALPGIGPERAEAIVAYRTTHGLFACPEEIMLVEGIGEETFDSLKGFITVSH